MDCIILGNKIRAIRTSKSLSQENVATDIGISVTAYSNIENGKTNIPFSRLCQIADYFEISLVKMFQWNEGKETEEGVSEGFVEYKHRAHLEKEIACLKEQLHNKEALLNEKQHFIEQQQQMLIDKDIIIKDKSFIIRQLKTSQSK